MAFSLNRAQVIGHLTRDPELRQTPNGTNVASFGLATNSSWKDAAGVRQEKAEFHNIVVWGKLAEICAQYLRKGMRTFVEGRLQTRDWEGQDGVKRSRTEIVAENFIMLDKKDGGSGGGAVAGASRYDMRQDADDAGFSADQEGSDSERTQRSVSRFTKGAEKSTGTQKSAAPVEEPAPDPMGDLPF